MPSYTSRILIVDDQQLMRNHMGSILKPDGYELHFAADGVEALEVANQIAPDLVLLDVQMPRMDGFETCRQIRNTPHLADMPVIIVTALEDQGSRLKGIEAGADDFLSKPYDSVELRARVRTITRLNRYQRLLAERTKFETIAQNSNVGYLLINDADRVVFANEQALDYLKLDALDSMPEDQTFRAWIAQHYQLESEEGWQVWPGPAPDHAVRYLVRPAHENVTAQWLQVDILNRLLSDADMAWVVSLRDITEQMIAQHDVWKFQQAVQHKLRTPLTGLISGLQFLQSYRDELSQEDIESLLSSAVDNGERLHKSIETILKFTNTPTYARSGRMTSVKRLRELAEGIVAEMELESYEQTLSTMLNERRLVLSEESTELILWELFDNTIKFHPEKHPTVKLRGGIDTGQTLNGDAEFFFLSIENDAGPLEPDQLKKVWLPFYQVERNFTGEVEGMGLGLATVASLVWGVGGKCWMDNLPDESGVCVRLQIPLADEGA